MSLDVGNELQKYSEKSSDWRSAFKTAAELADGFPEFTTTDLTEEDAAEVSELRDELITLLRDFSDFGGKCPDDIDRIMNILRNSENVSNKLDHMSNIGVEAKTQSQDLKNRFMNYKLAVKMKSEHFKSKVIKMRKDLEKLKEGRKANMNMGNDWRVFLTELNMWAAGILMLVALGVIFWQVLVVAGIVIIVLVCEIRKTISNHQQHILNSKRITANIIHMQETIDSHEKVRGQLEEVHNKVAEMSSFWRDNEVKLRKLGNSFICWQDNMQNGQGHIEESDLKDVLTEWDKTAEYIRKVTIVLDSKLYGNGLISHE